MKEKTKSEINNDLSILKKKLQPIYNMFDSEYGFLPIMEKLHNGDKDRLKFIENTFKENQITVSDCIKLLELKIDYYKNLLNYKTINKIPIHIPENNTIKKLYLLDKEFKLEKKYFIYEKNKNDKRFKNPKADFFDYFWENTLEFLYSCKKIIESPNEK